MKHPRSQPWTLLGVPQTRRYVFLLARDVALGGVGMLIWWGFLRVPVVHPWQLGIAVVLLLLAKGGGGLAFRWYWLREVARLQEALSPTLKRLALDPPQAIYSGYGIRLAWIGAEPRRAFEMLVVPRKREVVLYLVPIPTGFQLTETTVDAWCTFSRSDFVSLEEQARGVEFADRVVWKQLGGVALRARTPASAVERALELIRRRE